MNFNLNEFLRAIANAFPRGLKGEVISLRARIIAVADSYDAMTSKRRIS